MKKLFEQPGIQAIASSVIVTGLLVVGQNFGFFQILELRVFDWMMQITANSEPDSRLLIVGVNEEDIKELKQVRLISGRNSPVYSYGGTIDTSADPNEIGEQVLEIWNERVSAIREKYKHLRTVVLVKSDDLSQVAVFEFDTIRYDSELFDFEWNKRGNLG